MASSDNKLKWELDSIFPGGSGSKEYAEFRAAIHVDLKKAQETFERLPKKLDSETTSQWVAFLTLMQYIIERIDHASGFANCLIAQDVGDDKAFAIKEEISTLSAGWEQIMTGVEELAIAADDTAWGTLVSHPKLAGTAFFWNEMRRIARLKMEPKLERLAAELSVSGYHAWGRLYTKMAGDLQTEFVENGKTELLSMGQLALKFNSHDRSVRKQAFTKLEASWKRVDSLAAMALNSQAGFRLSLYHGRKWDSPVFEPFMNNRVKRETIEAMWDAAARGVKKLMAYVNAKKGLLGIDNFRWYDQTAPLGRIEKKYSYDEAADFVVTRLSAFSQDLGSFARMAIDRRWIEAENRSGKAAGGFCTGLDLKKESRIFMTFSGNYGEMMTLAHEIGHAYHSWVLRDRDYFARQYGMSLAESASTFNELLVTDAALEAADDKAEKLFLLDHKLQEGVIMFCNIRARYLFDSMFYQERRNGTISTERLNEMMVETQKTAFGEILAEDGYHPLFWASKMHFYDTHSPFYNFPYTFGFLFSNGIYDRAKKEGPAFAEKYKALLADTGSMTTEEVAGKHLGVDLAAGQFWTDAVERALADIEAFVSLAREGK